MDHNPPSTATAAGLTYADANDDLLKDKLRELSSRLDEQELLNKGNMVTIKFLHECVMDLQVKLMNLKAKTDASPF